MDEWALAVLFATPQLASMASLHKTFESSDEFDVQIREHIGIAAVIAARRSCYTATWVAVRWPKLHMIIERLCS
jgi:hypothetical protein